MMADKKQITRLLKTARGQIDGILKRANKEVLKAHMTHCVHDAVNSEDCDQKIEEMIKVLDNLLK